MQGKEAMQILINPGSGPVSNATEANAEDNMKHFITDIKDTGVRYLRASCYDNGDGRFAFLVYKFVTSLRCRDFHLSASVLRTHRYSTR